MGVDARQLYAVLSGKKNSVTEKFDIVNDLKVEVKRGYIDLEEVTTYFEALEFAINSNDSSLHSVGFSCLCHLVKRVITQDPNSLRHPASIALPMIIDKLGDQKSSVRDTTRKAFKDYWCASPAEVEQSMRNVGLCHPNSLVRSECLRLLLNHVQMQESKFAFRPFTPRVTALLNDTDETVSNLSQNLLVAFFKHAHVKAKQDLHRELTRQGVSKTLATRILKEVEFDPAAHGSSKPTTNTSVTAHEDHVPTGNVSLDFLTEQPGYAMEESIKPAYYDSEDRFREDMEDLLPPFEGKESEHNWSQREKNITRLRGVLRGNVPEDFREDAIWMLKTLSDGVVKSITSLRTQLSNNGCQLIKDSALTLGTSMDPVIEPYLTNLVRMTNSAKKITHQTAAMSINVMIANTSYSGRYLNQINIVMSEKVAQSKIYCATWMKILVCRHHRHKSLIENNGGLQTIEKNLQRGLSDANPGVREAMRSTFWAYYEVWPKEGERLFEKLDSNTKKALERVKPNGLESASSRAGVAASRNTANGVGKASRPGIREFINKSRVQQQQQQQQQLQQQHNSSQSVGGLGGKPARLGMPQRQAAAGGARRVPSATTAPTLSSVKSFASSETKKSSNSGNGQDKKLPPAKQLSDSSDDAKEAPESQRLPTLMDLITGIDIDDFGAGVSILTYLLKGQPVPDSFKCARPVSMPRPDIVSRVLQKAFGAKSNGAYAHKQVIQSLTTPDVISLLPQFVCAQLLLSGTVMCSEDGGLLKESLQKLSSSLDKTEAFNTSTALISEMDPNVDAVKLEACIDFLTELSGDISSHSIIVENVQSLCLIKEKLQKDTQLYNKLRTFLERALSDNPELHGVIPEREETTETTKEAQATPEEFFVEDKMDEQGSGDMMQDEQQINEDACSKQDIGQTENQELEQVTDKEHSTLGDVEHDMETVAENHQASSAADTEQPANEVDEQHFENDSGMEEQAENNDVKDSVMEVSEDAKPNSAIDFPAEAREGIAVEEDSVIESEDKMEDVEEDGIVDYVNKVDDQQTNVDDGDKMDDTEEVGNVEADNNMGEVEENSNAENNMETLEADYDNKLEDVESEQKVGIDNARNGPGLVINDDVTKDQATTTDEEMRESNNDNSETNGVSGGAQEQVEPVRVLDEPPAQAPVKEEDPFNDGPFLNQSTSKKVELSDTSDEMVWPSPTKVNQGKSTEVQGLNDDMDSKLSIYEDEGETNTTTNTCTNVTSNKPAVVTPTRSLRENNDTVNKAFVTPQRPTWFGFETKKQTCLSPLPQKRDEASKLFASLLEQLEARTIDSHGFRKLITIVRGSKAEESNSVAYETWRQENRQIQLQNGLLNYLNSENLNEVQMNQGLLQLKQLLVIAEPGSFREQEIPVFESLLRISGAATSKTIIYGGLGETLEELVKLCKNDKESRLILLDGILRMFDTAKLNREQKVLVVSTISKLIKTGKVTSQELRPRLQAIGDIIIQSISDKETYVRKEAYPALVSLRQLLVTSDDKALFKTQIVQRLSEGQQHLMDYYCKKKV